MSVPENGVAMYTRKAEEQLALANNASNSPEQALVYIQTAQVYATLAVAFVPR